MFFFSLDWLDSQEARQKREARKREYIRERMTKCVPWSPKMSWHRELNIQASTYKPLELWPELEASKLSEFADSKTIWSPSTRYQYVVRNLKAGTALKLHRGSEIGSVIFDGDVRIPSLHEEKQSLPWMSQTPNEIFTMRYGTSRARGDVIVAGLGLGQQLIDVSKRKSVKKLRLIEKSQELVDWILPRVEPHLGRKLDDVIVGDAWQVLPDLHADVALIDIFEGLGNDDEQATFRRLCVNIDYVWCWAANVQIPEYRGWGW